MLTWPLNVVKYSIADRVGLMFVTWPIFIIGCFLYHKQLVAVFSLWSGCSSGKTGVCSHHSA